MDAKLYMVETTIEFLVSIRPPTTCLTCETEKSDVIMKYLTPRVTGQRNSDGQVSLWKDEKDPKRCIKMSRTLIREGKCYRDQETMTVMKGSFSR